MILPTSLSSQLYQTRHKPNAKPAFRKVTVALSMWLCLVAHAQLPPPVESALNRAHISTDDISLMIVPVNSVTQNEGDDATTDQATLIEGTTSTDKIINKPATETLKRNISRLPAVVKPKPEKPIKEEIGVDTTDVLPPEDPNDNQEMSKAQQVNAADSAEVPPLTVPIRHLADIPRMPASTMKLIPTFIALDLLGPDFIWFTKAYYTGYISANTLHGDLIIKGSGDPKLTHRRLTMLLSQVRKAGIRHIDGDIVLDSSVFQDVGKDPAAFDNDPLRPYNASPDGLLINFNSIEMTAIPLSSTTLAPNSALISATGQTGTITPQKESPIAQPKIATNHQQLAKVIYKPKLADYQLPDTILAGGSGRCSSLRYSLAPSWQNNQLKIAKPLPQSCGTHTFYIAHPNVKDFAQRVVKEKWLNLSNTMSGNIKFLGLGNTLKGDTINTEYPLKTRFGTYLNMSKTGSKNALLAGSLSSMPSSPLPFVTYPSLPLSQQIYDINHYSNNVMTEQLTLSLPLYAKTKSSHNKTVEDSYSNYTKALGTIDQWWQQNLETPPPVMTNGSGLCRNCSVTADNLAELLTFAYNHPDFDTFVNSLGIAGISGTIADHANRLPKSEAIGRAWIKTGTLNNVTSMAGYVHGHSGQDYVVVGIINGSDTLNTYDARVVLDTMLDWTAKH